MPHASPSSRSARRAAPRQGALLFPLDAAYARIGLQPPSASAIAPQRIPAAYASLLCHESEMTAALERHHGQPLVVRPLSFGARGRWYARRVVLAGRTSGRPVVMGAIRVRLDAFPARVRARILDGTTPFGRVVADHGLDLVSRPRWFFELTPNAEMLGVFWMPEIRTLYGRRTALLMDGRKIGDVVEVLPLA